MAMHTYDDFLKAVQKEGWGEGNNFSTADWNLAKQNPDAGMSLLNAKRQWYASSTPEGRALANRKAEEIRSQYGGYTAGTVGDRYLLNRPTPGSFQMTEEKPVFSYQPESDPVYQAYRKQYLREGRRAAQDALGEAAAMTGGIPSSYAAAAASQAGDYYASQLSDKVPELYQQAYNRYANELKQWNQDRDFRYGQYLDEMNAQTADRQETLQKALQGAQLGDYEGLRKLGYNVDEAKYQQALQKALQGAQLGDYGGLESLGYDVSNIPEEFQKKLQEAQLAASVGDNSLLKEYFGIEADPFQVNGNLLYNLAMARANLGDYSYLNRLLSRYYG